MRQCGHERSVAAVTVILAAGVLMLWGPAGAAAQETASLEGPTGAYAEPFSLIGGIRELNDGRLLVSDALEEKLYVLDPELKTVETDLQEGAGTGRVPAAGRSLRLAG